MSTLKDMFKDMPTISNVGPTVNKLSYKEKKHRLHNNLWTSSDGSVIQSKDMTNIHIYHVAKILINKEDGYFKKKWLEKFETILKNRNTGESKMYLTKLALIK